MRKKKRCERKKTWKKKGEKKTWRKKRREGKKDAKEKKTQRKKRCEWKKMWRKKDAKEKKTWKKKRLERKIDAKVKREDKGSSSSSATKESRGPAKPLAGLIIGMPIFWMLAWHPPCCANIICKCWGLNNAAVAKKQQLRWVVVVSARVIHWEFIWFSRESVFSKLTCVNLF